MLGKGLESLIPSGGYQKPTSQPSQNHDEANLPLQSYSLIGQGEVNHQPLNYQSNLSNQHASSAQIAPLSDQYLYSTVATNYLVEPEIPMSQPSYDGINSSTSPNEASVPVLTNEVRQATSNEINDQTIEPIIGAVLSSPTPTVEPMLNTPDLIPSSFVSPVTPLASPAISAPIVASPLTSPIIPTPTTTSPLTSSLPPSIYPVASPVQSIPSQLTPLPDDAFSQHTFSSQNIVVPISSPMPVNNPTLAISSSPAESVASSIPPLPSIDVAPSNFMPVISSPVITDSPLALSPENIKPFIREDVELDYSRKQDSVFQIEVEKIFPNPHQPRRYFDEDALNELANSIREFGIIQPLVATKILEETEIGTDVTYQLIAGERRLMAAKKVGLRTVPVVIRRVSLDRERLELAIIENIQRENLNPLEAARGYARLQDEFGLTQREIAIRIGKSRETIANTLRLLNLPSEIQQALSEGKINESHARLLLQISDISRQKDMFQSILRVKPSVRALKATMRRDKASSTHHYLNPELISLQSRLEEFLGTKAEINDDGGKGKITINYYSAEELSALINRLSGDVS